MFHAPLSASQTHRWLHCPGSIPFIEQLREYVPAGSSTFAEEGTHAHHLLDYQLQCIYKGRVPEATDPELEEYKDQWALDVAIEYIQDRMDFNPGASIFLENYVQPFAKIADCGGTSDVIILTKKELEVIDYKHGRGVYVSPDWNSQILTYALGALEMTDIPVQRVRCTIVQPRHGEAVRNSPQQNGVLSVVYDREEVSVRFADELRKGISKVRIAQQKCEDPRYSLNKAYEEGLLSPGPGRKACKFCELKALCPATHDVVTDAKAVMAEFADLEVSCTNILDEENLKKVKWLYEIAPSLKDIASQVEQFVHDLMQDEEQKGNFPELDLMNRYGHRKWAKSDAAVVQWLMEELGKKKPECFEVKLKSPSQIETKMPRGLKDKLKDSGLITKPLIGTKVIAK